MKKLEFKQEHFFKVINHNLTCGVRGDPAGQYASIYNVISVAQAKHDEWLKELMDGAKVVHGYVDEWSHRDFSTLWLNLNIKGEKPRTHQALLIDVKEIEKKPCVHEPMSVYDKFGIRMDGVYKNKCAICGVDIEPTEWKTK